MKNTKSQPLAKSVKPDQASNQASERAPTKIANTLSDFTPSAAFAAALKAVKNMGPRAKNG